MLETILVAMLQGTFDQINLAEKFHITQDELKAALEQLCFTGYLTQQAFNGKCSPKNCAGCMRSQGCQNLTIYQLTEKGKKIASTLQEK